MTKRHWRRTSFKRFDGSIEFAPDDWTLYAAAGQPLARIYRYLYRPNAGRWSRSVCRSAPHVLSSGAVRAPCAVRRGGMRDRLLRLPAIAEPLFLQVKEARRSVLEQTGAAPYQGQQGRRVVEGQRTMQAATDIFLGWTEDEASGRQFYIRRLKNRRLGGFSEIAEHKALADYARLCGRTLARAHARSGDPAMIAGYMGKGEAFDDAIASFAILHAERSAADYAAFLKAKGSSGQSSEKGF